LVSSAVGSDLTHTLDIGGAPIDVAIRAAPSAVTPRRYEIYEMASKLERRFGSSFALEN
jgi:hypothetical protein